MQAEFESMFKQMASAADQAGPDAQAAGAGTAASGAGAAAAGGAAASDASFQDTIRRTMERMQNSGDQATAAAASGSADDFMSELLKQMSTGDVGGEGSEEDFSKMLMGMMEQLTNKEILYEPMKELHDKFPEWLEKNRDSTPADDLKRYEEQKMLVSEIVAKFDSPTYADSNAADREYIVERMQKVGKFLLEQHIGS
jgi:peroxin-19